MARPARRQVKESKKDTAYIEGNYDYNIWYDKYLTDRNQHVERAPSLYKCNPEIDTGYTKADKFEKKIERRLTLAIENKAYVEEYSF
jgi:hypothetical protein